MLIPFFEVQCERCLSALIIFSVHISCITENNTTDTFTFGNDSNLQHVFFLLSVNLYSLCKEGRMGLTSEPSITI